MKTQTLKKTLFKMVVGTSLLTTVAIAGIGFLHTPMGKKLPIGRKLLALMGMKCPLDLEHLSAQTVELNRELGVQALRGRKFAPQRPSLAGLILDKTTEAEAWSWVKAHSLECSSQVRGMHYIKCPELSPHSLRGDPGRTPIHMLTLGFAPNGKLVAVDIFRRQLSSVEAASIIRQLSERLTRELGKPNEQAGSLAADSFVGKSMKSSFVHYRYRDYLAMLTATLIPWSGGVVVHEQYSSAL